MGEPRLMDEPEYQHGDLLARAIEEALPEEIGGSPKGAPVDLKILDDEVVVAFPTPSGDEEGGGEDPAALAAVFAAESPRGLALLGESFLHPGRFYLDGEDSRGGDPEEPAGEGPHRLVVDAAPRGEDEELYERVGAVVVADERAAAREIARLVWAIDERERERERERKRAAAASRKTRGGENRLERLRAAVRASAADRPALSTGQLEENLKKEDRAGSKKRGFFARTIMGVLASFGLVRLEEGEETGRSDGPTWRRRIPGGAAELIWRSPFPGVALITNNKGGTGKTTVATNLAVAAARIARPKGYDEGLPVLLVEQNYGNSDIRDRIKTPGAIGRGLMGFVEDLRAGRDPDISHYVTAVSGFDNLDALLISDRDDEHEQAGKVTLAELDAFYESAAEYYRLIVVDLDKGLPQEETMVSDTLRFWLTVCDVTYLVHDASKDSLKAALKVAEGARGFYAKEAATGGEPRPLVPVRNKWREGEERWGASADDEEEWEGWVALLGADWAVDREGRRVSFLKIPDDPQCDAFARQQRQIALADWDFALAFEELAREWIDRVVKSRLAQEQQDAEAYGE